MLPKLSAVVMGKNASKAKPYLETTGLPLLTSDHPSPLVKTKFGERWNASPSEWGKVRKFISQY